MKGEVRLQWGALAAAFVLLAAWLILHGWLAFHTDAGDVEWMRLVSLVGSIEAVVFAAAGALFGTTVQRQRVEDARERAEEAEEQERKAVTTATANTQLAANGRALASAVKALGRAPAGRSARLSTSKEAGEGANDELISLARELFPD